MMLFVVFFLLVKANARSIEELVRRNAEVTICTNTGGMYLDGVCVRPTPSTTAEPEFTLLIFELHMQTFNTVSIMQTKYLSEGFANLIKGDTLAIEVLKDGVYTFDIDSNLDFDTVSIVEGNSVLKRERRNPESKSSTIKRELSEGVTYSLVFEKKGMDAVSIRSVVQNTHEVLKPVLALYYERFTTNSTMETTSSNSSAQTSTKSDVQTPPPDEQSTSNIERTTNISTSVPLSNGKRNDCATWRILITILYICKCLKVVITD